MQLAAWTLLCLVLAVALRRRPFVLLVGSVLLWFLVPGVAGDLLVGPPVSGLTLHPASVAILVTFCTQLVVSPRELAAAVGQRREMFALLVGVCVVAVCLGFMTRGLSSFAMALEEVCAPVAAFLLLGVSLRQDPRRLALLCNLLIGIGACEALFSVAQLMLKSTILYQSSFEKQYWFSPSFDRWMGTLDHPLILGMLLAVVVPLLARVGPTWRMAPLLLLMLTGEVVAQSRAGLTMAVIGAVYVMASRRSSMFTRLALATLVGSAALVAWRAGYFDAFAQRVTDDTGSSAARGSAWDYFLGHIADFSGVGRGMGASYDVSGSAGLGTSFENSFIMFSIDLGLLPAIMYFGVMCACCVRAFRQCAHLALPLAATAALIAPQTFSGLSSQSVASCLVWLVFAMAAYGTDRIPLGDGPVRRRLDWSAQQGSRALIRQP